MFTRTLTRSTLVLNTLVRKQNLINSKFVNVNSKLNNYIRTRTRTCKLHLDNFFRKRPAYSILTFSKMTIGYTVPEINVHLRSE